MDTQQQDVPLRHDDALIVVDVQNDFLPGGRLAVPHGDEIVPVLNAYIDRFVSKALPVFATRDWHPAGHCSFRERGGPWPPHCIAGTKGAAFASGLSLLPQVRVLGKAMQHNREAYSGFDGTDLAGQLRQRGVRRVFIGGLATDYCVFSTVKDALKEGFATVLLRDAVLAVDVRPGDGEASIGEMRRLGARLACLEEIR